MSNARDIEIPAVQGGVDESLLRLDNQLCFALYAATRAMTKTYREKLEPIGLTYPQYLVLLVLWENENLTISQIGEKLMLDSGTLTPLIKRLESMQLVTRNRDTVDERQVHVALTDQAHALKLKVLEARRFVGCRLDMTEAEILALRSDIIDIINRLHSTCDSDVGADWKGK